MYVVYLSEFETMLIILAIILIIIYISYTFEDFKNKFKKKEKYNKTQTLIEKGKVGEDAIVELLSKIDIYHKIVRNVYITNEQDTRKTEIDIIFITTYGLFVIESKNFKGNIYGYDHYENWIQYINRQKNPFPNPILQNNYHINFLCNKLKLAKKEYFKSYIVFGKQATLKAINFTKEHDNIKVINSKDLIEYIFEDMHNKTPVLSHEEVDAIYIELQYYCMHLNR